MELVRLRPDVMRPRVLLVDDDEGVCTVLSRWISDLDCDVVCASDAEEALDRIAEYDFDVAFCDVLMPGYNGLWLAEQIATRSPQTAVAFVTGLTELDGRATLRTGVIGYLTKPVDVAEVQALVLRGLAASRRRRSAQGNLKLVPTSD